MTLWKTPCPNMNCRADTKPVCMMTSSNGNIFRVTGPLRGEFTGHRWIPLTKVSDAELWCFLWSPPEQTVEQTIGRLMMPSRPLWRDGNGKTQLYLSLLKHGKYRFLQTLTAFIQLSKYWKILFWLHRFNIQIFIFREYRQKLVLGECCESWLGYVRTG